MSITNSSARAGSLSPVDDEIVQIAWNLIEQDRAARAQGVRWQGPECAVCVACRLVGPPFGIECARCGELTLVHA